MNTSKRKFDLSSVRFKIKLRPQAKRNLSILFILIASMTIFLWRIFELPEGLSNPEASVISAAQSGVLSPEFIVHAPYNALLKIVLHLSEDSLIAARLLSAVLSASGLVAFFLLARKWWSITIALTTTGLLGTSYWFLLSSRLVHPHSASLLWLSLLLLLFLGLKHQSRWWHILGAGAAGGLSLYHPPLMGWVSVVLSVSALVYSLKTTRKSVTTGWIAYFGAMLVTILPLLFVAGNNPKVFKIIFGLERFSFSLGNWIGDLIDTMSTIFISADQGYAVLPGVPLVDIIIVIFATYGLMRTLSAWKTHRSHLMLLLLGISIFITLYARDQALSLVYWLPVVYIYVGRGINQYFSEWKIKFPRNKSAHYFAVFILALLAFSSALYNLRTFYTAWARSDTVQSQFIQSDLIE